MVSKKYKHLSPWGTGVITNELISLKDLAPTILSMAGSSIPEHMKGRPFMGEEREKPRKYVFGSRNRLDETPGLERTVFDGRFVYSRNFYPHLPVVRYQKYGEVSEIVKTIRKDNAAGVLNKIQSELLKQLRAIEYLYDIQSDKWEVKNLATNPVYKEDLIRLRKVMKERVIKTNDIHFIPEGEMRKASKGSTAFEIKKTREINPTKEILEVAELVGVESNPEVFLNYLKHENKHVRYWASVGLNFLGQTDGIENQLLPYLKDKSVYVQIEIAILLYKTIKNSKAKGTLINYIMGEDKYATHHTIQQLLYLPSIANDFTYLLRVLDKRYGNERLPGFEYTLQNSVQMYLYLYDNQKLYYTKSAKWIDDLNSTVRNWN